MLHVAGDEVCVVRKRGAEEHLVVGVRSIIPREYTGVNLPSKSAFAIRTVGEFGFLDRKDETKTFVSITALTLI